MYQRVGFKETGFVPKAGMLRDGSFQDAKQLHFDLESQPFESLADVLARYAANGETGNGKGAHG